ncbi:hypothetical protein P3T21_001537 [Paraburkholderia sp. GAS334]
MTLERRPPTRERLQRQTTGLAPSDRDGPLFEHSRRSNDRVTQAASGSSWPDCSLTPKVPKAFH